MTSTTPTRFDSALFAAAKAAGNRAHRSAAQQLEHWARLGQELEASAGASRFEAQGRTRFSAADESGNVTVTETPAPAERAAKKTTRRSRSRPS